MAWIVASRALSGSGVASVVTLSCCFAGAAGGRLAGLEVVFPFLEGRADGWDLPRVATVRPWNPNAPRPHVSCHVQFIGARSELGVSGVSQVLRVYIPALLRELRPRLPAGLDGAFGNFRQCSHRAALQPSLVWRSPTPTAQQCSAE